MIGTLIGIMICLWGLVAVLALIWVIVRALKSL
jgi:hypothetical protein